MNKSIRMLVFGIAFLIAGCRVSSIIIDPHMSDSTLQFPDSDLSAQTSEDPQKVFELALSRTLSGNGVQIHNGDRTEQLICNDSTFWLIQEEEETWSFERQANNESQMFGLFRDSDRWIVSPSLTTHDLTDQDISRYLNDTDRLRLQLKTFLFPGQNEILFGLPGEWTWEEDMLACTSGYYRFRFVLDESGAIESETIEGGNLPAPDHLTFQSLNVPDSYIQWLSDLFDQAETSKAGQPL